MVDRDHLVNAEQLYNNLKDISGSLREGQESMWQKFIFVFGLHVMHVKEKRMQVAEYIHKITECEIKCIRAILVYVHHKVYFYYKLSKTLQQL